MVTIRDSVTVGLVDQSDRETAQVPKASEAAETLEGSRLFLVFLPFFFLFVVSLLFIFLSLSNPDSNGIKYRYSRVDRNSLTYHSTNFHHLRVHRQNIGIAAVLRADPRQTTRLIRNSAILLTICAGCVRMVRERQFPNDGRQGRSQ